MIKNTERDKLINAIIYFVEQTNYCHKIKLWKLLYFLDFEHFQQIGRSVTGLNYFAWPKGPVPQSLHEEIDERNGNIDDRLNIRIDKSGRYEKLVVEPNASFDSTIFSPRELRIMRRLAEEHKNHKAEDMVEATHIENRPWHQIFEVEGRRQELIPYDLGLKRAEKEDMEFLIKDRGEFLNNHK